MGFIRSFAQKIGLDKSIAYSSGARIVQGVAGVGSIFFISTFLTGVEQGFYFTFASILALQVFFELGLTGIMTQYVAHEVSHLKLDNLGCFHGESRYISRLSSLLHFCIKWYAILAFALFLVLVIVGYVYFTKYGVVQGEYVAWQIPWLMICFATALQLFISPLTSVLTGIGFVKETSKISFFQQLIVPICSWIGLIIGLKLYVISIGYLISILVWCTSVIRKRLWVILYNLYKTEIFERVTYISEIFPYQWKIALSWVSGYFIFQLFNPVLFATEGAVVAGQMGMTLQALNAIGAFSMSWLNTKIPLFSQLIALKDYENLDQKFNTTLRQMTTVCFTMLTMFYLTIVLLKTTRFSIGETVYGDRFLDYLPLVLMMIPLFINQYTGAWATYLRCHKKEPFLPISIVEGILCTISTLIIGKTYGLIGITLGYCTIRIIICPWAKYVYVRCKNKWHNE